jgi:HAE1 family hydrophobic/amphiphilic exporter-1
MSIINLSVKRPVGTIMFYVGVILLGVISYTKLAINLLPDLSFPKITVVTHYAGSGPEEIERFITSPLEGPLASIKGVKKITSVSQEGVSIITLEFHWGTDMDFAMLHTKEKTEEVRSSLPDDHEAPVIMEMDPSASPIMIVILDSDTTTLKDQKDTAEYIIKPRLEQLEGISAVEIRGGDTEEISVEIDPDKIKNLGITLSDVSSAILQNNESPSGGTVKKDKFRYTLKIEGELKTPKEIESIVIANLSGRNITIKDIGTAFYKNKLKDGEIRFNSHPAISMLLYRESGGNTVNATHAAEKALENLEKEMTGIRFTTVSQEAELIIASINSLKSSLILGAILAIFTLLLFLQNYRDPLLISVVIPIAIISTFVLMFFFNVQVNIMSLGGLVLGVGMFVDNCIIVLESIFRHRDKENLLTSVLNGAQEVSGAITASTFTTISIFLPVIYLYGVTGKLFRDQALTVSFSLISSLVVAITLLPALSAFRAVFKTDFLVDTDDSEIDDKNKKLKWYQAPFKGLNFILLIPFKLVGYIFYFIVGGFFLLAKAGIVNLGKMLNIGLKPLFKIFNRLYDSFDNFYHKLLEKILNRKILALYISLLILLSILGTFLLLDKELLPAPESSKFEINGNTIPAYGFEETNRIASEIETELMKLDKVKFVFTESGAVSQEAGRSEDISVNSLHFIVNCVSPEARPEVMNHAREILTRSKLMDFSLSQEQNTLSQYLASGGDNFQIKVFYDDIERGKEAVKLIVAQIKDLKGLQDIKTTTTEGKPAYAISFKKDLMNELNISKDYISNFINQAVRGEKAGEVRLVQKNYDIYVRVPVDGIMAMSRLLSLPMTYNNNTYYLKDLIDIETRPSVKRIEKERQNMFFLISADAPSAQLNKIIKKAEERMASITFPPNTRATIAGEEEERRKAFDSLNQAIWLAIMLVYMIMAAKFENIWQPLIIMFTVPMGLIGAFLILLLTGNTLNIISGIGIMVLIGIGVNDAIVKIEYANQMRKEGMSAREAVLAASKVRLRPILMTSLTTIFGVMPMALMRQTGSELQRPLALVVIGGLIFTTFLTLLLIPAFYEMLENFKDKRNAKKASQQA